MLRVVLIKPSKYARDGGLERFRRGFMPNSTLRHLASMTPAEVGGHGVEVHAIDEYVETDLKYLKLLERDPQSITLLALVGVQSHQFHRALDLAAYARAHDVEHAVIGGPHAMTCDTSMLHGRGVSFALAEAELIWSSILTDAVAGELRPVYGEETPWQEHLDPPVLIPPRKRDLRRYAVAMLGVYPARGCPYRCNFCSVIKIAGRHMRSQPIETTLATLRAAKAAGVQLIMFTTDNFNKYGDAEPLLEAMIEERLELPFFVQCDTQVVRQPGFVELLGRAGCYQMFVGVESFNRATLLAAKKNQNHPERYRELARLCRTHGIGSHFSNIIGFPTDNEAAVLEHLAVLKDIGPDVASFYILTPIPGTEQYEEFLNAGWITEPNLDRFDATCATWRHPYMSDARLNELLFQCYQEFYAGQDLGPDALARIARTFWVERRAPQTFLKTGSDVYAFLAQVGVAQQQHPMAGGIYRVTLDTVDDYLALRQRTYGVTLAPLPHALQRGDGIHPPVQAGTLAAPAPAGA